MGISRMLRHVDANLVARIQEQGRIEKVAKKPKLRKPRNGQSYRAARRKEAREAAAPMVRLTEEVIDGSFDGSIELNRSEKFSRAKDYSYAREIGPSKEPVR